MKKMLILFTAIVFIGIMPSSFGEEFIDLSDEIRLEEEIPFQLKIDKTGFFDTYSKQLEEENNRLEYKKGDISFFSEARKELNDYMTNDYKSGIHARYGKEKFSLAGGYEVSYRNANASLNSKKIYIAPTLNLRDNFSLSFANKVNPESRDYEQEFGLNFAPKLIKNANFGIKAGTVWGEEGDIKSQSLKFNTDLFVF